MTSIRPRKIFLDANVVIRAGKPPGGPLMRVADLVNAGYMKVVTTDLTKVEIAKKHAASDFEAIGNLAVVNAVAGHRKGAIKDGPCFSCWTSRLLRLDPNIAAG